MSPIASHSQESKEQPSPAPAPGARAELIPGAGFRQSPVAPGAFQRVPGGPSPRDAWGSFVQEPAHWQLRVCSQVPAKAEIFIYGFFLKDKKMEKKVQRQLPGKGTELFTGSRQQQIMPDTDINQITKPQ